ncbi:carbon monoxide dehydrogenase subunit G [Aureimonas fodinaquatilis]|uniref:Carbon monoxide dehydrogenase subunit G n=1 Tax=Aureimonas fodinaquatilis TaxID=2565783 RepID=A0A5B0E0H9_9HYPH|nr:carbon monoxide dehydrogenase subunit G [Aureimonas fodinaquatilis]KAA0972186.1 carbon monoxide dehydrogenase subunit G [Aureimonas fodinaquatilis]
MELTGTHQLDQPPEVVWAALFDSAVLAEAIPGCTALEQTADNAFAATVKLKIGPVSAQFKGDVEISDINAPHSCLLTGKGSGGVAGYAKGSARVELEPAEGGTILRYTADAALGGKLASLGSRLIQSTTNKLAQEFFTNFSHRLNS